LAGPENRLEGPEKRDERGRRTTSGETKIGYLVTRWVARKIGFELVSRLGLEPRALDVPTNRITAIINGQRGITGDTAVRLATLFDTTAEFWMNLQKTYELRLAERALLGKVRKHIERHRVVLIPA
jgi:addiction module HigA family antidote